MSTLSRKCHLSTTTETMERCLASIHLVRTVIKQVHPGQLSHDCSQHVELSHTFTMLERR
jgi:hypothetical protein